MIWSDGIAAVQFILWFTLGHGFVTRISISGTSCMICALLEVV